MKTRRFLFTFIAALMIVSCTKYYRVLENDTPVYDELDDSTPVLFTLNEGEIVYSIMKVRSWLAVYRTDSSGQNGWARVNKFELIEGDAADSLGDLVSDARHARRRAEANAAERHRDSIIAAHPNIYYRVVADSLELFNADMSTQEGRKSGQKVGSMERGRLVGQVTNKSTTGREKWIFVHNADGENRLAGFVDVSQLERVSKAENDSLNIVSYEKTTGYICKNLHPALVWICLVMLIAAVGLFVWMLLQQRKRHLLCGSLFILYFGSIIIVIFGAGSMDGGRSYGWCYRLLPVAWYTMIAFPLLYTNMKRPSVRRIFNWGYLVMIPMCLMLYAHHQDGAIWPPIKMYLLNAFIYLVFVAKEVDYKCPYCSVYGGHKESRVEYAGTIKRSETVSDYHASETVRTETNYDMSLGRNVTTKYIRPSYWTSRVKTTTVDIYNHYNRCCNCGREYIFEVEEK